jgi:hypothetical protein
MPRLAFLVRPPRYACRFPPATASLKQLKQHITRSILTDVTVSCRTKIRCETNKKERRYHKILSTNQMLKAPHQGLRNIECRLSVSIEESAQKAVDSVSPNKWNRFIAGWRQRVNFIGNSCWRRFCAFCSRAWAVCPFYLLEPQLSNPQEKCATRE